MKRINFRIQQDKVKTTLLVLAIMFLNALPLLSGCSVNNKGEKTGKNRVEAYRITWWQLPNIEGSKTGNFARPDHGLINIYNGELNIRHAILEGRDLGDYRLPYWPIRSFVSIFSHPVEIAHRCTLTVKNDNKNETFLFRTGDPSLTHTNSFKRVEEGFELARIKNGDVLKITNRGSDSPVLTEHFFVVENGKRNIPVYIKTTNITDKKLEDVEVGITYSQDFNWSSFGVSNGRKYEHAKAPNRGNAHAFFAFSSGMESGFEFQVNKNCELSYQLNEEFNAWDVSVKNTPVNLAPGESFIFSYNLTIINKPLEGLTQIRYLPENEFEKLEFSNRQPSGFRTAPTDLGNRVTIHDVIENIEKPKVRGLGYIGGSRAQNDLALMNSWGGNLAITRSNDADLVAFGHKLEMEMLLRGMGSFKTGEPLSFEDYFKDDLSRDGYPDSYGQDEDHYYWYPVKPTLNFEKEFGKTMSEATLVEKVDYWNRCFVNKWRLQLDHIRKYDPHGNIWFYAPSPGMPYVDPFDYYDMFFKEVSKFGDEITVFPFYYGIDFNMPEYMMRRWKNTGIHRAVFLPGGPTYARPSQFFKAITSARRGGADGTCGFSFTVTEENFDDEWRWKSIMLASHANFPTPELDAYCFIEEPSDLIEKLAEAEVTLIYKGINSESIAGKLKNYLPGRVTKSENLPQNYKDSGQLYVVVGDNPAVNQSEWLYNIQHLEQNKGVLQLSDNVLWVNGSGKSGIYNALKLFLRFAEIGSAESRCNEIIEANGLIIDLKDF